jgi:small subunit ribosomal protein S8
MTTTNDPISDFMTRIRNASMADHAIVEIPGSKFKFEMAKILEKYGYLSEVSWRDEQPQGVIEIELKYDRNEDPMIRNMERVSKPSRRVYVDAEEIPEVLNGLGIAILSTSRGVMTDREARSERVGGEYICKVY